MTRRLRPFILISGTLLSGGEIVFVDPIDPSGNPLVIQWFLDGQAIEGATGETLDLTTLQLDPGGMYELSVTVRDMTIWVRDEAARDLWMTESRNWLIELIVIGDLNCDGDVNAFDIEGFLQALFDPKNFPPDCDPTLADINQDGAVDAFDIEPFIELLFP